MNLSRRNVLFCSVGALALAGCSISAVDGVTTITLNVATVNTYAQAIQLAANALLSNTAVSALFGSKVQSVEALIGAVASDISAFDTAAGGAATFSFNASSVPAALTSLESDADTLLGYVKALAPSAIPANFTAYVQSLETIVPLLLALSSLVAAPKTPMTEAEALAVVGLKPAG